MKIKEIFDKIGEMENHTFVVNQKYEQTTPLELPDENGEYIKVKSMIIKEDILYDLVLKNKPTIEVGSKHYIQTIEGLKFANALTTDDKLSTLDDDIEILDIVEKSKGLVYDISVDSDSQLYTDANGLIHHNTYHVEETLKSVLGSPKGASAKWRMKTGSLSPFALYQTLFFERDKIIFFDDADAVWKNEDTINMMKAALDTRPIRNVGWESSFTIPVSNRSAGEIADMERELDVVSMNDPMKIGKGKWKLPSEFEFTGRIIFTSNKSAEFFAKIGGGAIKSRSLFVDVKLRREDLLARIKGIAIAMGYEPDIIEDAMEALAKTSGDLSIRALVYAIKMQKASISNWKDLASRYL